MLYIHSKSFQGILYNKSKHIIRFFDGALFATLTGHPHKLRIVDDVI